MAKYRKKPVVIEAVQYKGGGNVVGGEVPKWMWRAFEKGVLRPTNGMDPLKIRTLEGELTVAHNDYIIRGVEGELYPCKPHIFEQTYEPV